MLFLDYMASQLNLTWSKNKSIYSYITQSTTMYIDPSQPSRQPKQTKLSKKEKKAKKKKWDFGSESDEDINNGNTIIQDENDVIESNDLSRSPSPILQPSSLPSVQTIPTLKPKKFKPKSDPVPLELTLLKPMLLMNVSGKSVSKAGLFYLCALKV